MINLKNIIEIIVQNNPETPIISSEARRTIDHAKQQEKIKKLLGNTFFNHYKIGEYSDAKISALLNNKDLTKKYGLNSSRQEMVSGIDKDVLNDIYQDVDSLLKEYDFNLKNCFKCFNTYLETQHNANYYRMLRTCVDDNQEVQFWTWFVLGAMLQEYINQLSSYYENPASLYEEDPIINYLNTIDVRHSIIPGSSLVAELKNEKFWKVRREVIKNSKGKITIVGQSLKDAFDHDNSANVLSELISAIENGNIKEISILVTDPSIFDLNPNCIAPISDIDNCINNIISNVSPKSERKCCNINIYFVPLLHIDHAVITSDYMLFRSTKLWTSDRAYKGGFFLYRNTKNEENNSYTSEYKIHASYIETIKENCIEINMNDIYSSAEKLTEAQRKHNEWRRQIKNNHSKYLKLHKLYTSQLTSFVANNWMINNLGVEYFSPSDSIQKHDDLYNYKNFLNDHTQEVLLPYIRETERIFNKLIDRYDSSEWSGVRIYPSLDLGFPNNVQRLSGGFATGMFIQWQCGTHIIPVDATVNVCTSSVFRLDYFDPDILDESYLEVLLSCFSEATRTQGYSFNFESGNHFFMIAVDEYGHYYLVLHSSSKEFKNSYMGLYPTENNWYSDKIKVFKDGNRYLRYIKDVEADFFSETAKHIQRYNEQIHEWIGCAINNHVKSSEVYIKHHYYMPTDQSIAIGTFVEEPGTVVPLFSNVCKPVYLFRASNDNWKINVNGVEKCLIPHGWGQKIDVVDEIYSNEINNMIKLHLKGKGFHEEIDVISMNRINVNEKVVRDYKDGNEFLKIGNRMLRGNIEKTLFPKFLYCKSYKGLIK